MAEPQQGKMLDGRTPDAAFAEWQRPGDPQVKFDAACRYLLAHHKRLVKVTQNGITLRFGRNVFTYRNQITGRLIGQTVLAWFNPETPEILSVTDLDREHPFAVELAPSVPAIDATPEQLSGAIEQASAHMMHARAYYRTLRSAQPVAFRRNLVDDAAAELGREMHHQQTERQTAVKESQQRLAKGHRAARSLNMRLPSAALQDTESVEAAARLAQRFAEDEAREHEEEGK